MNRWVLKIDDEFSNISPYHDSILRIIENSQKDIFLASSLCYGIKMSSSIISSLSSIGGSILVDE